MSLRSEFVDGIVVGCWPLFIFIFYTALGSLSFEAMLKTPGRVKKKEKKNEGMDFPSRGVSSLIESYATL